MGGAFLRTAELADLVAKGGFWSTVPTILQGQILPTLGDPRMRFRTLVAMNALSIIERESPEPSPPDSADVELARKGDV